MEENSMEDIKILEEFIDGLKQYNPKTGKYIKPTQFGEGQRYVYSNVYYAIEHILSDYKRVLKENEELNLKYYMLYTGKIENLKAQEVKIKSQVIPVQKVKDKIEKEIKYHERNILEIENTTMLKGKTAKEEAEIEFNKYAIVVLKKMLQELLERRK